MNLQSKSIQRQIVLWAGSCLLLISVVFIGYAVSAVQSTMLETAQEQAIAISETEAGFVRSEIEEALDTGRTVAQIFAAVDGQDMQLTRKGAYSMLFELMEKNYRFVSVYTVWEPDAFDERDMFYADTKGHDETGRLTAQCVSNEVGDLEIQPITVSEVEQAGEWYSSIRETQEETVHAPSIKTLHGIDRLITTITIPILSGNKFLGAVGIDLDIQSL